MIAVSTLATDEAIRRAAIERMGCVDGSIVRQTLPGKHPDGGTWFVLAVKRSADSEWELIGRRRTKAELWRMAENREIAGT